MKKREKKEKRKEKKENRAKQTRGVLKSVMQEDRNAKERLQLPEEHRSAEEEQIPVARTNQHEEDNCCCTDKTTQTKQLLFYGQKQHEGDEDAGIRPVGREMTCDKITGSRI